MTTQKKTFIGLEDIVRVRIECSSCHSSTTIPINREASFKRMGSCPNCGESWLTAAQTQMEPAIAKCVEAIRTASHELNTWHKTLNALGGKGFSFSLEINPLPE
jgi:formate dehydrogenase maturation protein FdhE